jgi:dihydroorotate dehydrogenase (fumarate)
MWRRLQDAGAAAIVLPSLFEEEIENDAFAVGFAADQGADMFGEALSYLPSIDQPVVGPGRHLALVEQAREQLEIPVIASLNGTSPGGWVRYAKHLADAGAHAIELNLYDIVADTRITADEIERRYVELVEEVKAEISVPLAVKLGPWFTAFGNFAGAQRAGACLVLFNRLYQPDIDLDTWKWCRLSLSTSSPALALGGEPVRHGEVLARSHLAACDGAGAWLLLRADVVMTTARCCTHGPEHIETIERFVRHWMAGATTTASASCVAASAAACPRPTQVYEAAQLLPSSHPGARLATVGIAMAEKGNPLLPLRGVAAGDGARRERWHHLHRCAAARHGGGRCQ